MDYFWVLVHVVFSRAGCLQGVSLFDTEMRTFSTDMRDTKVAKFLASARK